MNDPHVKALHYWVNHDDSVSYANAKLPEYDNELFHIEAKDRKVTIKPKSHYSSEEEARVASEDFIRHWEFEAALESGSSRFSLSFLNAEVIDRNPDPDPPGVIRINANPVHFHVSVSSPRVTIGKATYPGLPAELKVNPEIPLVQTMLTRLDMYHRGRDLLGPMAYFCLTALENSVAESDANVRKSQRKNKTTEYYNISNNVFDEVRKLSSYKGGLEARKGDAANKDFTQKEKTFLVSAIQTFIRRAAQKSANPDVALPKITLADLPKH